MVTRVIIVVGTLIIVAAGLLFFVIVVQQNIKHKKDLEALQTNYEQLQKIRNAEHDALIKRDNDYQEARKAHESQVEGLIEELNKAKDNDKCIDKKLPVDVSLKLREPSGRNELSWPKSQLVDAN